MLFGKQFLRVVVFIIIFTVYCFEFNASQCSQWRIFIMMLLQYFVFLLQVFKAFFPINLYPIVLLFLRGYGTSTYSLYHSFITEVHSSFYHENLFQRFRGCYFLAHVSVFRFLINIRLCLFFLLQFFHQLVFVGLIKKKFALMVTKTIKISNAYQYIFQESHKS